MIQAFKNATLLGYANLIVNLLISLISVPLFINYLNNELYGIWTLILSLTSFLGLTNFGIPTAATVFISSTGIMSDKKSIFRKSIILLSLLTSIIILSLILIRNHIDWAYVFGNISYDYVSIAKQTTLILGCTFLIKTLLSLSSSGFQGIGRPDLVKLYELLGSLFNFFALVAAVFLKGSLITLAWASSISSTIVSIICFLHFLFYISSIKSYKITPKKKLNVSYFDVWSKSIYYFQAGIASMLIWNTDLFFISHILGISFIAEYTISQKLFSICLSILTMATGLLVPFYTNLISQKKWHLLNKIYFFQASILQIGAGIMWIGLTILAKPFINIWTGRFDLQTNYFLIFIFGAYGFILSRVHIYSGLITAFNAAKFISIIAWSEAILNLIFTYFLIKYLGLPGAILGTFLASFVCPYLILPRYIYKISKSKIKIPPENLSLILITIIFVVSSLFISLTIKTPLALLLITIIVISFYLKIIIKNLTKEQLNDSLKIFYNLKKNLTNFI